MQKCYQMARPEFKETRPKTKCIFNFILIIIYSNSAYFLNLKNCNEKSISYVMVILTGIQASNIANDSPLCQRYSINGYTWILCLFLHICSVRQSCKLLASDFFLYKSHVHKNLCFFF